MVGGDGAGWGGGAGARGWRGRISFISFNHTVWKWRLSYLSGNLFTTVERLLLCLQLAPRVASLALGRGLMYLFASFVSL